jgi:hypothetical protein
MSYPLSKLPNTKAQKELKQFLAAGYTCAIIAFFVFGFLSIIGIAFSARCLLLSRHEGNKNNPKIKQFQTASVLLLILSVLEFGMYVVSN